MATRVDLAREPQCLCRRHHRLKQRPGWSVQLGADATATWRDPYGRTLVTTPVDLLCVVDDGLCVLPELARDDWSPLERHHARLLAA